MMQRIRKVRGAARRPAAAAASPGNGRGAALSLAAALAALGAGCAGGPGEPTSGAAEGDIRSIDVGADEASRRATAFPESVLVFMTSPDGSQNRCSGALVAPRAVLTAGHCLLTSELEPRASFRVVAPFAGGATATGTRRFTTFTGDPTPPVSPSGRPADKLVDRTQSDVGLIFLDSDICLDRYPALATAEVADRTPFVTVGRVFNGRVSNEFLYASDPNEARTSFTSFPLYYLITLLQRSDGTRRPVTEPGDSGGPSYVHVPSGRSNVIEAVTSNINLTEASMARVAPVAAELRAHVAESGGDPASCGR
jgi:hypothetical protein